MPEREHDYIEPSSASVDVINEAVSRRDWPFLARSLLGIMCADTHDSSLKQDWLLRLLRNATEEQEALLWSAAKIAVHSECPHGLNQLSKAIEERLASIQESDRRPSVGEMIDLASDLKVYGLARPYERADVIAVFDLADSPSTPAAIFHATRFDSIEYSLPLLEQHCNDTSILIRESVSSSIGSYFTRSDLPGETVESFRPRIEVLIDKGMRDAHWFIRRAASAALYLSKLE
jgi:hypothetical protein